LVFGLWYSLETFLWRKKLYNEDNWNYALDGHGQITFLNLQMKAELFWIKLFHTGSLCIKQIK
jgi:hypothetical protein